MNKPSSFLLQSFVLLILFSSTQCKGSMLPFTGSELLGSDLFSDPFKILEYVPLALERDENLALSPARVDWRETATGHQITVEVPGMKREELKIEVEENRILRISGERKREERESKGDHWHCSERSYGKFWRQFRLPENVDLDSIKAKLEDGVLAISIDKLSPDRIKGPKVVSIGAGGKGSVPAVESEAKQEL